MSMDGIPGRVVVSDGERGCRLSTKDCARPATAGESVSVRQRQTVWSCRVSIRDHVPSTSSWTDAKDVRRRLLEREPPGDVRRAEAGEDSRESGVTGWASSAAVRGEVTVDEATLLKGKDSLRVKGVGGETEEAIVKGAGAKAPLVGGGGVAVKATMGSTGSAGSTGKW